jgi:hypothetical protein
MPLRHQGEEFQPVKNKNREKERAREAVLK